MPRLTSKVYNEGYDRITGGHSHGSIGDFVAGAAFMAELFAEGQGALRETMEAIRNDLRLIHARDIAASAQSKCSCDCTAACPLSRTGMERRCTADELREEVSRLQAVLGLKVVLAAT